jgi:hypothetical protein
MPVVICDASCAGKRETGQTRSAPWCAPACCGRKKIMFSCPNMIFRAAGGMVRTCGERNLAFRSAEFKRKTRVGRTNTHAYRPCGVGQGLMCDPKNIPSMWIFVCEEWPTPCPRKTQNGAQTHTPLTSPRQVVLHASPPSFFYFVPENELDTFKDVHIALIRVMLASYEAVHMTQKAPPCRPLCGASCQAWRANERIPQ